MSKNTVLSVLGLSFQATDVEWKIRNFFDRPITPGYLLNSSKFSLSDAIFSIYMLTTSSKKYRNSLGCIGLCLKLIECPSYQDTKSSPEYRVAFRLGIRNVDDSTFIDFKNVSTFTMNSKLHGKLELLEINDLLRNKQDAVPDDILTIFCSAKIVDDESPTMEDVSRNLSIVPSTAESASQTKSSDDVSPLSEDFKNIYISRRFTDVTLVVKNKEFHAHRTVLAARSPVFASMFEHNLSENCSGNVKITDCDPTSFEDFLLFLYTGKLDEVPLEKALGLYKTADKYDVKLLKNQCVQIIQRNINTDLFCDVTHLATMYGESDLLNDAINFFIDNAETILSTVKWQQFLEENSLLCNELLMKLVKSKK